MTWQPEIDEIANRSTLETAEDQESKRAALENYSTNSLAALSPRPRRSTSTT